jgi:hypothetical protein
MTGGDENILINQNSSEISKRISLNPYTMVESFFKKRKLKKRERQFKMKMAILSGGIKRMK